MKSQSEEKMKLNPRNTKYATGVLYILFAGLFLPGCSQTSAPETNQIAQAQNGNPAPQPSGAVQGENPSPQMVQPPSGLVTTGQFEQPPVVDIGQLLSPEMQSGPGFQVGQQVATNGAMHFTIGKGLNDDRYIYRYEANKGFTKLCACPDLTGSYLSFDGENLYLSQWYEQRILKLDEKGNIVRNIDIGAEICGHVFADGAIYVLRGTENVPRPSYAAGRPTAARFKSGAKPGDEQWWIARVNPREEEPEVVDVAKVPFAARSLTFDGKTFWSNHRAANETVCFSLPS